MLLLAAQIVGHLTCLHIPSIIPFVFIGGARIFTQTRTKDNPLLIGKEGREIVTVSDSRNVHVRLSL